MEKTFIARTGSDGEVVGQFFFEWSEDAAKFLRTNRFKNVYFEGKWGDMSFLSEFADFIENIVIINENLRADGVASLANLKALTVQSKMKKPVSLKKLSMLERCNLKWDPSYMQELFALPKLESVYIGHYSADDFLPIAHSRSIKRLRLSSPKIVSFKGLSKLSALESLHIEKAHRLKSFDGLSELRALNNLYLSSAKEVISCDELGKVTSLVTIQQLRGRHYGIANKSAAQHFQHAVPLFA